MLSRRFDPSLVEIKNVLMEILDLKVSSVNGFMKFFYKSCWDIIGSKVVKIVHDFFNISYLLKMLKFHFYCFNPIEASGKLAK